MIKKKNTTSKESQLLYESNTLIETFKPLNLDEKRLLAYLITHIHYTDTTFKDKKYRIFSKDFNNYVDTNRFTYAKLKDMLVSLRETTIHIKKDKLYCGLIEKFWYESGEGYFDIEFAEELGPYLLQLKKEFTILNFEELLKIGSVYSFDMYKTLKQFEKLGQKYFSIEKFRERFGVQDKYKKTSDLKRNIIDKAKEDLEETDISFDYTDKKSGRTVTGFQFNIFSRIPTDNKRKKNKCEGLLVDESKSKERLENAISNADENMLAEFKNYIIERFANGIEKRALPFFQKNKNDFSIEDMIENKFFPGFIKFKHDDQLKLF